MKTRKKQSIRTRFIIAFSLMQTLLLGAFSYDQIQKERDFLLEHSTELTIGLAYTYAISTSPWVLSNDLAGIDEITEAQTDIHDVNFAIIFDLEGNVISYKHRFYDDHRSSVSLPKPNTLVSRSTQPYYVNFDNDEVIDVTVPITISNTQIGWSRVQISRHPMQELLNETIQKSIFFTILASIMGALLAFTLGRYLTKPIYGLLSITSKIRKGESNASFPESNVAEFESLNESFKLMMKKLEFKEEELLKEKDFAETTLKSIADGVLVLTHKGNISFFNPAAHKILDLPTKHPINLHINNAIQIYDLAELENTNAEENAHTAEFILHPDSPQQIKQSVIALNSQGRSLTLEMISSKLFEQDKISGAVMIFRDISDTFNLQKKLFWEANHDSLTKLSNRKAFEEVLENSINSARTESSYLLYIDLDQFKLVNDTVGHHAGDLLLKRVAKTMEQTVSDHDFLARIGGDEFAIIMTNTSPDQCIDLAESIRKAILNTRFFANERMFEIGCSVGISNIDRNMDGEQVLSQADMACYLAKEHGRNRIEIFEADNFKLAQTQFIMDWVSHIKKGIQNNRFKLYAQQIYPLQPSAENQHFEILIRFQDEQDKIISPAQFLSAAERYNLMPELDIHIIQNSIKLLQKCHRKITLMNINISGQSLGNPDFTNQLHLILKENHELNHKLCFEITETVAISQIDESIRFLEHIKSYGCKLALDDFGSGFSSFTWLKQLPVDFVKIDGSFIKDVHNNPVDNAMVDAIQTISKIMNIQSIAEFVENKKIADWLIKAGIDYAQGFYYCEPQPIEQLIGKCAENEKNPQGS
jgi:diguanylate cyclase (GGDEF)-like protein